MDVAVLTLRGAALATRGRTEEARDARARFLLLHARTAHAALAEGARGRLAEGTRGTCARGDAAPASATAEGARATRTAIRHVAAHRTAVCARGIPLHVVVVMVVRVPSVVRGPPGVVPAAPAPCAVVGTPAPPTAPAPPAAQAEGEAVAVIPGIVGIIIEVEIPRTADVDAGTRRPEAHNARGARAVGVTVGIALVVSQHILRCGVGLLLLGAVAAAASVVGIHVPRAVAAAVGPVALGKGTVVRGRRKGALRTARGGGLLRRAFLGRRHEVNVVILCIGSQTEESRDQE